jgi:hypothetical protein
VVLDALPRTPHGKVDQQALPAPQPASRPATTAYIAPQSELEQLIAEIWRMVLLVETIGIEDNFFDIGGHSLSLLRVHSQLVAALGRELPLVALFQHPTIETLAGYLRQQQPAHSRAEASHQRAQKQKEARQQRNVVRKRTNHEQH